VHVLVHALEMASASACRATRTSFTSVRIDRPQDRGLPVSILGSIEQAYDQDLGVSEHEHEHVHVHVHAREELVC
jgi:hypothetical protein